MNINAVAPDLDKWIFVKERGAVTRTGKVFRSPDGTQYLRTGPRETISAEATFAAECFERVFPVPEVTDIGAMADGMGFFIEKAAGEQNYGNILRENREGDGTVTDGIFAPFSEVVLRFLKAQLASVNHQVGPVDIRKGIQLANVLEENPDIPPSLFEEALAKAQERLRGMPVVLTHGDLTPYNVMEGGVIDFEQQFIAPFGYDAVTAVTFQRFWDHPGAEGIDTMKNYEFSEQQIAGYLARANALCAEANAPLLSPVFDDHLMLKSIWALCRERPKHNGEARRMARWNWRRNVTLYCLQEYMAGRPIQSSKFRRIGREGIP